MLKSKFQRKFHSPLKSSFFSSHRFYSRRLTPEQKALVLSYAELDKDVDGTINGLTQAKTGKRSHWKFRLIANLVFFLFFQEIE
jgi:hypothetical protein